MQHMQQGELGVVLRSHGDRIVQGPLGVFREILTEKNSAHVVGVGALFICRERFCEQLTYYEHRAGSPAHHPVGHRLSVRRSNPRRPCDPMTITSVFCACANAKMESEANPSCITSSG